MFLMWDGSEFQAAGPATANEQSPKCILVRRTVKLPRTDDRRRWSLHRLHQSVKYPGAVPWKTSNIKTHSLYFMRLVAAYTDNEWLKQLKRFTARRFVLAETKQFKTVLKLFLFQFRFSFISVVRTV